MTIKLTKRTDDWHAAAELRPELWGCGQTIAEAIGDMMLSHPEKTGVTIKLPDENVAPA